MNLLQAPTVQFLKYTHTFLSLLINQRKLEPHGIVDSSNKLVLKELKKCVDWSKSAFTIRTECSQTHRGSSVVEKEVNLGLLGDECLSPESQPQNFPFWTVFTASYWDTNTCILVCVPQTARWNEYKGVASGRGSLQGERSGVPDGLQSHKQREKSHPSRFCRKWKRGKRSANQFIMNAFVNNLHVCSRVDFIILSIALRIKWVKS